MSERKEYLVQVTVVEARHLKGLDSSGSSDPYIKITCGNLEPQVTVPREKTNMAVWNQSFTFSKLMMNEFELETWELLFEAYDRNIIFTDGLLGSCSIGLGTMYRHTNHEFFRCFLSLYNTEKPKEPQGFLMVSCYIIGPDDKAPVHTDQDVGLGDTDNRIGLVADEDMSADERYAKVLRDKNIHTVDKPGIASRAYQLSVNIYKAEGLPPGSSAFVAVRCGGVVLKTPTVEANENPAFQTTVLFPVYSPFMNDNVTVKVWNYFFGRANQCIAQVCDEYGTASDFNLSTLLRIGQVIGTRWYNLYSVREDHREIFGNRTREGKEYVGRILMRVSLLTTDNPQLGTVRSNIGREPLSMNHILLVDVFELRNVNGLHEKIWVVASIGGKETPRSAYPEYNPTERAFTWKTFEKQKLQEIDELFPINPDQCPDIFIYLWHEKPGLLTNSAQLAGYARIKTKDCMGEGPKTQWISIKSIVPNGDSPGELLANIQFAVKGSQPDRGPTDFEQKNYRLKVRIKSGFYMAPKVAEDTELETYLHIYVGKKKVGETAKVKGRYPFWNYFSEDKVKLNADLKYEGDLVVLCYRDYKSLLGAKTELVGQFALKLLNVRATRVRVDQEGVDPNYFKEYYNLVKESQVHGRILAFFDLEECSPEEEQEGHEDAIPKTVPDGLTVANIEKLNMLPVEARITITALGLRNLISSAKKPVLKFKLTNDPTNAEYKLGVDEDKIPNQSASCNPYILNTVTFDTVLPDNISDWPYLQISLTDDGWFGTKKGYTTLLLFPFANFVTESAKKATILMLNTNVDQFKTRTRAGTTKKGSSLGSKLSHRSQRTLSGSHRSSRSGKSGKSGRSLLSSSSRSLSVIESVAEENEDGEDNLDKVSEKEEEEKKEEPEPQIKMTEAKSVGPKSIGAPLTAKELSEMTLLEADKPEDEKALIDLAYQMHFNDLEPIQCTKTDKRTMKDEAELLADKLDKLKKELMAIKGGAINKIQRDKLIKEFNRKIELLKKKGDVDVDEFRGFDKDLDDEEAACLNNREVIRDVYETTMDLPYSRVELYSAPTFGYRDSQIMYFSE